MRHRDERGSGGAHAAPPSALGPADLRQAMGRFATGVTVLTTLDADGKPHGMTANAVTSVSLEPPLVLVCVRRGSTTAARIHTGEPFALSILAADQAALSERFADDARPDGWDQLSGVVVERGATGQLLIGGALGTLECRVDAVHDGGDHLIVVGEVVALRARRGGAPLVFHDGAYLTDESPGVFVT